METVRRHRIAVLSAIALTLDVPASTRRRRKRRCWVQNFLLKRGESGAWAQLVPDLNARAKDGTHAEQIYASPGEGDVTFTAFFRMNRQAFDDLLHIVGPYIQKENTHYRASIPASERLAVTLRYLASGESYASLRFTWRIGYSTISAIIPEVCAALWRCLKPYIKTPTTRAGWTTVADGFEELWDLPHCLGALDGKHVTIKKPEGAGTHYHNYKGRESIVLMALVDAGYRFTYVDIGANGKASDGGVFKQSRLFKRLEDGRLDIPPTRHVGNSGVALPYAIVADEAFCLKPWLMKPYPKRELAHDEHIYNYRLSRGRRVVENAFGLLVSRFRLLEKPIALSPARSQVVVQAMCGLHNFIMDKMPGETTRLLDELQQNPTEGALLHHPAAAGRQSSNTAKAIRDRFRDYFNNEGAVAWQEDMI